MKIAVYDVFGKKIAGDNELKKSISASILKKTFPVYEDGGVYSKLSDGNISFVIDENTQINDAKPLNKNDFLKKLLLGNVGNDIKSYCGKYELPLKEDRRIVLAEYFSKETSFAETLTDAFEETVVTVAEIDANRIALICPEGEDSIEEIAGAVMATFNELNAECNIGISCIVNGVASLAEAYEQALSAIEVGKHISYGGGIWYYSSLLPELAMLNMDEDKMGGFLKKAEQIQLDNETTELILAFFKHDQNISQTATYLPCHRNTLIYNLDKIQKDTGFNLRVFDDAVSMRLYLAAKRILK